VIKTAETLLGGITTQLGVVFEETRRRRRKRRERLLELLGLAGIIKPPTGLPTIPKFPLRG